MKNVNSLWPCGTIWQDLGQHWLRRWLVTWKHEATTWTNFHLSSIRSHDINLRVLSCDDLKNPTSKKRMKNEIVKLHLHLPGANNLAYSSTSKWFDTKLAQIIVLLKYMQFLLLISTIYQLTNIIHINFIISITGGNWFAHLKNLNIFFISTFL